MTSRPLDRPDARLLNHVELVYAPGERDLALSLLRALGFRVLDPRESAPPEAFGEAGDPYAVVFLDEASEDVFDNVLYVSEVTPAQWGFECGLRDRLARDPELARLHDDLARAHALTPQAMTHFGIAYPSLEVVRQVTHKIATTPALADRVTLSKLLEPGDPDAAPLPVAQTFLRTDLVSAGLLCTGQQIELQVRLDGV